MNQIEFKKANERRDLVQFLRSWPFCPPKYEIIQNLNEPPDFILKTDEWEIGIEHTTASPSDQWYIDHKYRKQFDNWLCDHYSDLPYKIFPFYVDSSDKIWIDLWNNKEEVFNWLIKYGQYTSRLKYARESFGSCEIRLNDRGNYVEIWLGHGEPYMISNLMYERIIKCIINSLTKKIVKYNPKIVKPIDLLLIIPKYSEPIVKRDLELIKGEANKNLDIYQVDNCSIRELTEAVFKEVWVYMCDSAIRIYPIDE